MTSSDFTNFQIPGKTPKKTNDRKENTSNTHKTPVMPAIPLWHTGHFGVHLQRPEAVDRSHVLLRLEAVLELGLLHRLQRNAGPHRLLSESVKAMPTWAKKTAQPAQSLPKKAPIRSLQVSADTQPQLCLQRGGAALPDAHFR